MAIKYNKAVRDRIPEIIRDSGKECKIEVVSDSEFLTMLESKLGEELKEYVESGLVEELADILEIIYRISELKGKNVKEFEKIRIDKKEKRGGFEKNIVLMETS